MKKGSKARRKTRALTNVGNERPQSRKEKEKLSRGIPLFFTEPYNSRGLHPPFKWYKLAQQVEHMDDIERYKRLERQNAELLKELRSPSVRSEESNGEIAERFGDSEG
jgi:hypothetical protein